MATDSCIVKERILSRVSETDVPYAISFVVHKPVRMIGMFKVTGTQLTEDLKVNAQLDRGSVDVPCFVAICFHSFTHQIIFRCVGCLWAESAEAERLRKCSLKN